MSSNVIIKLPNKNEIVDIGVRKVIIGAHVGVIGAFKEIIFINDCDNYSDYWYWCVEYKYGYKKHMSL